MKLNERMLKKYNKKFLSHYTLSCLLKIGGDPSDICDKRTYDVCI